MAEAICHGLVLNQERSLGKCASYSGLTHGVLADCAIDSTVSDHGEGASWGLAIDDSS